MRNLVTNMAGFACTLAIATAMLFGTQDAFAVTCSGDGNTYCDSITIYIIPEIVMS